MNGNPLPPSNPPALEGWKIKSLERTAHRFSGAGDTYKLVLDIPEDLFSKKVWRDLAKLGTPMPPEINAGVTEPALASSSPWEPTG